MSKNQINKYVWLVETLYRAKKITLKEINRRWLETDLSEGLEIPRRTFHTWKNTVEDATLAAQQYVGQQHAT